MQLTKKSKALVAGVALVGLAGTGTAYAYWTTSGSGTGSATTGTSAAVSLTQLGTTSGLVPGGSSVAVDFNINNPASTNQYVTSVSVAVNSTWSARADSNLPACTAGDFTIVQPTATYGDLTPGDHAYRPSGASIALNNGVGNQDNCKSVSVPLVFASR